MRSERIVGERIDSVRDGAMSRALHADLLQSKATKFGCLASILQSDAHVDERIILTLMTPCSGVSGCRLDRIEILEAGTAALEWVRANGDSAALKLETHRLFGGGDLLAQPPLVFPCGSGYLAEDPEEMGAEFSRLYESAGYRPPESDDCPTYIAVELRFMAYLLTKAAAGDMIALDLAQEFLNGHLRRWGSVFAAATATRSEHPVTRFAGLVLENMLFCTSGLTRLQDTRQPWELLVLDSLGRSEASQV